MARQPKRAVCYQRFGGGADGGECWGVKSNQKMGLPHFFCVKILGLFGIVFKKMGASILLFDKINSNFFCKQTNKTILTRQLGRIDFLFNVF